MKPDQTEGTGQNIPEGADVGAIAEEERRQNGSHRNDFKQEKQQREKIRMRKKEWSYRAISYLQKRLRDGWQLCTECPVPYRQGNHRLT